MLRLIANKCWKEREPGTWQELRHYGLDIAIIAHPVIGFLKVKLSNSELDEETRFKGVR